ncbi:beta-1,6-N-acetylglucosaminyltransferase [Algoriphagus lacus]|uniref:beta-1,6-N-acetylglucosaminyltransferase n=1 Tax=Algoriphagus lacus TaxID=2056311 RepID=UPI0013147B84|nr:beta-1,6-N-acetylglucosaminyltransferase [Algoriphagus lacus]
MRVAFVILGYKNPTQIRILIEHLIHSDYFFFIHIDKRIDISPFKDELRKYEGRISWVKRETSYWGSYQCVKALLNGLRQAIDYEKVRFDYFIHLSGQDFPLKSPDFINRTLSQYFPTNFVNVIPFPVLTWEKGGIDRLRHIKLIWKGKRIIFHPEIGNWVLKAFYKVLSGIFIQLDRGKTFYGGEFYFMMHRTGVERLLSNIRKYPIFFHRLKFVTLPEEIIIQTILMMDYEADKLLISEDRFRYIDWETGQKSPKEMNEGEIIGLLNSPYLFGRKFIITNPNFKVSFNE